MVGVGSRFLVALAGVLLSPLWLLLQLRALRDWRGGWRLLAAVPAAAVAAHLLVIAAAVARDRTSHNLWPFELGMSVVPATALLGALALLRRRAGRQPAAPAA